MIRIFKSKFKSLRRIAFFASMAALVAACEPTIGGGPSINTQNAIPVALLLPYGSPNGAEGSLAQSLENAARLAMADLDGVEIDLRVYPTAASADQAASQAATAVNDGAKIILGPVFGAAANAAGIAVASQGINVLSFSNNTAIAGRNVFVLGNTFDNTADQLVRYLSRQGSAKVLTVYPQTATGEIGRDAVQKALSRSNVASTGQQSYPASQNGIIQAVRGIAANAQETGTNVIFFTDDTSGGIPLLSQLLPENGVSTSEVQFVGLTRWDIPATTLSLPGLQNGLFALPDPVLSGQFRDRYIAAYGAPPHPIAGLAYDGIAAVGALVSGGRSDALTVGALTQNAGFAGVTGVFRLRSDGTNQRGLAIARIVDRQVQIVSPAPKSFGSAGF